MPSAKVTLKLAGTVKATTYTNDDNYSEFPCDQPVFFDYYTDPAIGRYFYLSRKGILNPEETL